MSLVSTVVTGLSTHARAVETECGLWVNSNEILGPRDPGSNNLLMQMVTKQTLLRNIIIFVSLQVTPNLFCAMDQRLWSRALILGQL